jgi:hypothetical protein
MREIHHRATHLTRFLVAFSKLPSVSTWLENASSLVAFSESPSVSTWLENAPAA